MSMLRFNFKTKNIYDNKNQLLFIFFKLMDGN